jgi:hypothetical protein
LRGNHSKDDIERILLDIRQLKAQSNTDNQIMETLSIPLRTYRRYLVRIYKDDKIVWLSLARTQLEPELLRLKESFESTYKRALELSNQDDERVLEALYTKDDARMNIVKLLVEGPKYVQEVEGLLNETKKKRKMDIQREEQEEITVT